MESDHEMQRILALETRLSTIEQQQRAVSKRDAMQFIVSLIVIAATLFGVAGLVSWQNAQLIGSLEKRIDALDRRIEQSEQNTNAHMTQLEQNMNARMEDLRRDLTARFDDLKQIVLSQKK